MCVSVDVGAGANCGCDLQESCNSVLTTAEKVEPVLCRERERWVSEEGTPAPSRERTEKGKERRSGQRERVDSTTD